MAENASATARPPQTEEQIELREKAKRMAKEKGMDWKAMSAEERKEIKKEARRAMKKAS